MKIMRERAVEHLWLLGVEVDSPELKLTRSFLRFTLHMITPLTICRMVCAGKKATTNIVVCPVFRACRQQCYRLSF